MQAQRQEIVNNHQDSENGFPKGQLTRQKGLPIAVIRWVPCLWNDRWARVPASPSFHTGGMVCRSIISHSVRVCTEVIGLTRHRTKHTFQVAAETVSHSSVLLLLCEWVREWARTDRIGGLAFTSVTINKDYLT